MSFIRGRPRHPQSQGVIERANGVLTDALGKWMFSNQTDHWSEGLMPVVYGINTRVSQPTKVTAYEVVFGQKARCDSDYWRVVNELNCVDEDDLPTPVGVGDGYKDNIDKDVNNVIESLLDLSEHVAPAPPLYLLDASISIIETEPQVNPPYTADVSVNLMSFTSPTKIPVQSSTKALPRSPVFNFSSSSLFNSKDDNEVQVTEPKEQKTGSPTHDNKLLNDLDNLINFDDEQFPRTTAAPIVVSNQPTGMSAPSRSIPITSSPISSSSAVSEASRHKRIRETAEKNYLQTTNKKRIKYDQHLKATAEKFNIGDCVGLKIDSVDRTNTDPKLLPCIITAKEKKNDSQIFKLASQYGKLVTTYTAESLVDLKSSCLQELRAINLDQLADIKFIEACKLLARGSISGKTCDCKGQCQTKLCSCKKQGVYCSTKCHSRRGGCKNIS
ncbi:unnamed protein product [Didymodactylos carnosus]|uniref:Integrase catalytic domain-containing protein n=1 Tax=Didymodactylos carnosus TaxID=1234261 RepID=A0A815TIS3_9BILA|nr:unnamed protein product [Didymodactylos carnosus]CAF1507023.1 unnamed protein product [Didymodactylos carnosus]CAF4168779.1 unnamed protein product [Didymodactylos carnosus]CAF4368180.1 unnamed protein product [Didymodactylos carnosus]